MRSQLTKSIWCCGCNKSVDAELTNGTEIYPHRSDLASLPFWICRSCNNYVGTHHKSTAPLNPLGHIPTSEIRIARRHIHALIDPIWKNGKIKRGQLYSFLSKRLGYDYHTADIKSLDEARHVYRIAKEYLFKEVING